MTIVPTLSLNNIINIFQSWQQRSNVINAFGFGDTSDLNALNHTKFPILWVEPTTNTLRYTGSNAQGYRAMELGLNVYIMDRINKGETNYMQTLSDTLYNITTLIAEMEQDIYYVQNNFSLVQDISIQPVTYVTDADTNGYMASLKIRVPMRYSPCNSPTTRI